MPRDQYQGPATRCVHHGNRANKTGNTNHQFVKERKYKNQYFKPVGPIYKKERSTVKDIVHDEDKVIVGQPPKEERPRATFNPDRLRFTIPNVPANQDIIMQQYKNTHEHLMDVLNEIHDSVKFVPCVSSSKQSEDVVEELADDEAITDDRDVPKVEDENQGQDHGGVFSYVTSFFGVPISLSQSLFV